MINRYEEAAEAARRGLELARSAGLERGTLGVYLIQNLSESLFHLGRWKEAERLLSDAADARPAGYLAGLLLQLRGMIRVLSGRDDAAAEDIRAASRLNVESVDYQFELPGQFGRAELARVRGDLGDAREHVRIALEVAESMVRYRWPLVWLGLRIEAEAPDPDPERVAALRELAAELPTETPAGRAYRELAAAEAGRPSADWAAPTDACRELGDPYLLAYALVRQAEAACGRDDRDAATAPLDEALRIAAELGAAPLLEAARSLARRARIRVDNGEPQNGIDAFGLTEREREVLDLLADGCSNPQIAEALFISRKTASAHVSNIIAKLGVTSRGEAAAVAHRAGAA
jgi:DNA-binding CsgD family transcriptional regulator